MKRLFLNKIAIVTVALVTMSMAALAQQKGDMAVGANLVLGSGSSLTNIGLGAKFQYNIMDPIRAEGSFTYFLPKNYGYGYNLSMWDLSANGHYLFPINDQLTVYPLAGLCILGSSYSYDSSWLGGSYTYNSGTDIGFNIGGGVDFHIAGNLVLNGELKYKIVNGWNRLYVSAGIAYLF